MEKPVRLDKFLADAGAGTRSEVKKYIQKGQVQVNGKSVKKPELKVTEEDQVVMNGQEIHAAPEYVYYLFNKPAGCVSATEDFRDKTVLDYIEEKDRRKGLFPVGRLDKDTEGFLLITDDGPLAHELLSPKKHVDKTYYAKVSGKVTEEDVVKLAEGVDIGEKDLTRPARLEILSTRESGTESAEAGAAEDIGLANPNALLLANACFDTLMKIGWPEGRIPLAETTIYLATSPKSNSAYSAINDALVQGL